MDFVINENELTALCGLPHIQQLAYLRGIRPYMDVQTGLVGIKRGISYQSIAEQLYIEPHQGIKSESCSRAQWMHILKRAGIDYRNTYQTRHTYASMMLSQGENIMWVSKQLGHVDVEMVIKTYGRWIPDASTQSGYRPIHDWGILINSRPVLRIRLLKLI